MSTLFPLEPKLTERQRFVLDRVTDGDFAHTGRSVGLALHEWSECAWCRPGAPCRYAEPDGVGVLRALEKKSLVRRRRGGSWVVVSDEPAESDSDALSRAEGIPW